MRFCATAKEKGSRRIKIAHGYRPVKSYKKKQRKKSHCLTLFAKLNEGYDVTGGARTENYAVAQNKPNGQGEARVKTSNRKK